MRSLPHSPHAGPSSSSCARCTPHARLYTERNPALTKSGSLSILSNSPSLHFSPADICVPSLAA